MATEQKSTQKTPASPTSPATVAADADSVNKAHEQRVTVPGAPNVDARLDNRVGADRPKLETFPAKPQQIDGPDVTTQLEHTRATLTQDALGKDVKDGGERKGMFSPGPHGLSEDVEGRELKAK